MVRFEVTVRTQSGDLPLRCQTAPILDEAGLVAEFVVSAVDVSDELIARQSAHDHGERLAFALDAARCGTFEWNTDTGEILTDDAVLEMYGFGKPVNRIEAFLDQIHPTDLSKVQHAVRLAVEDGITFDLRFRIGKGVRPRWLHGRGRVMERDNGAKWLFGLNLDITEEMERRERLAFLNRELNHRVKNLFSILSGIVRMTAREDDGTEALVDRITDRIEALSAAYTIGMEAGQLQPVRIEALLDRILLPYGREYQTCRSGLPVLIPSEAVPPLGMILNEMATNAQKHGAWSVPDGMLDIAWQRQPPVEEGGPQWLQIDWTERGGPHRRDASMGFGTQLVRACTAQLDGEIERNRSEDQVHMQLRMPLVDARREGGS
ncbi:HWE histidine kinase domain-containing protein [Roseicyclus sp. F158]|uniref:histidine kinase n=1 Tax=Tropicimonas omnivorans TaxID=3075590 RepID=A0ABU3DJ03_9RHOB|nr:HWE histidine kinase domain-containing protein [Roseicyclus sp. F158]MDT0683670.1 HWE histidine kinase domain-containing protein [Roseicyclus sp. F158]